MSGRDLVGWEGYIRQVDVPAIFDDLVAGGYKLYRFRNHLSVFNATSYLNESDFALMDTVVNEATSHGLTIILDVAHNFPQSAYINSTNEAAWTQKCIRIGLRYNGRTNLYLEPINEYTGTDEPALYQRILTALRNAGVTLPIIFVWMSGARLQALNDPLNRYAYAWHGYGSNPTASVSTDNLDPPAQFPLEVVIDMAIPGGTTTIRSRVYNSLEGTGIVARSRAIAPLGCFMDECGPSYTEGTARGSVTNPTTGGMAYAMWLIREASRLIIAIGLYQIMDGSSTLSGNLSRKHLYESRALSDFGIPYYQDVTPLGRSIGIQVRDLQNMPVADCFVTFGTYSGTTGSLGLASIDNVIDGPYTVNLSKGGVLGGANIVVDATHVLFYLQLGVMPPPPGHVPVRTTVIDFVSKQPMVGVAVEYIGPGGAHAIGVTDASGGYEMALSVNTGPWLVRATSGTKTAETTFNIGTTPIGITLEIGGVIPPDSDYINELFKKANAMMDTVLKNPMPYLFLGALITVFLDRTKKD